MRRSASLMSLVALVLLAACSRNVAVDSEPAPSSSTDPVGVYDFSASMGGIERTGRLEIERSATGAIGGRAILDDEPEPAEITSVTVNGDTMVVEIMPPGGEYVVFTLTFTGSSFTGNAIANGMTIPLTGSKRAP